MGKPQGATIDLEEVKFYNSVAASWWDSRSPFRPLLLYNKLRIPFLKDALNRSKNVKPLYQCRVLDVGCGGGYLSEGLSSEGAEVVGLDSAEELLIVARNHQASTLQKLKSSTSINHSMVKTALEKLRYIHGDIVEYAAKEREAFDAVISSEVIEHVENPGTFAKGCADCLKPEGVMVITTPNRTWISYLTMITLIENLFKMLPKGTHQYKKFIKPTELEKLMKMQGLVKLRTQGVVFLPWPLNKWYRVPTTSLCYMMSFKKKKFD